jgi:hypothetical protein
MKVPFTDVFEIHANGSISPRQPVYVNGTTVQPGIRFGKGVRFGDVELAAFTGRDIEIEHKGGTIVIKRFI